ncbi:MAG: Bug family tripartite tricarboxylate transporter substrate binding protein [Betaproteobacteria bacterium]
MRSACRYAMAGMIACAIPAISENALAQAAGYPSRTIRIIVPFAPGPGPNDFLARLIGQKLSELWGQPAVIDNRGGAGGTIGVEMGAKSPPDGYTLTMGAASTLAVAPSLYPKLGYHPLRDFAPISALASVPYALIVNPNVPAKNVKELVAIARAKKGFLNYGSSGVGSMSHLAAELFKSASAVDIVHVPYKGTPLAMTDVITGQIDMMFNNLAAVTPHEKAGKLRVLALANGRRSAAAPQLPTMAESGVKGYAVEPWYGIVAPARTPKDIVSKLNATIVSFLKTPEVLQTFQQMGYEMIASTPEEFGVMIRTNIESFARVIEKAGIKPNQ